MRVSIATIAGVTAVLAARSPARAQAPANDPIPIDTAKRYFAEAQRMCSADGGRLWGVSLCGPIMFVDPSTRSIVASESDAKGALVAKAGVFVGVLPSEQNVANTSIEWSGVKWTQMMWPLPGNAALRTTLMAHELFHRVQDRIGVPKWPEGQNAHLDERNGRYYMLLEWRALSRAMERSLERVGGVGERESMYDALAFRSARYRLWPTAAAEERALEMNEGLAEYTGVAVGNQGLVAQRVMAELDLKAHIDDPTFVRSFAYATGPAYGLLLDDFAPGWRSKLESGEAIDEILARTVKFDPVRANLGDAIAHRAAHYDYHALAASEDRRDSARQRQLAYNRARYVDGPTLTLAFQHMNVRFDPRNLQPLGDKGTVYPTIHISDAWGIIDAKNGALMKPDWSALVVAAPKSIAGSNVEGDGWTLELKPGWSIVPGATSGDYVLAPPH